MKIGIETSSIGQMPSGIGSYTQMLLSLLQGSNVRLFFRRLPPLPFAGSLESLFKRYRGVNLLHFPEPKILYGIRPNVPFVLTIHDVMPLKFPAFFPKKHTLMMRHFLPRYLKEADQIICVSETTRRDLTACFPFCRPVVIPCGIVPIERNPHRPREPFFLYVGSFEKRKNLGRILGAFARLKRRGLSHKLILAGGARQRDQLPFSLPAGVKAVGYVSEKHKQHLLERATALVWPSLYEGFGIPLLEAMASGTPVITSDRGACPETVADAALIVDPQDQDAIADAMEEIAANSRLSDQLKERGLRRAQAFAPPLLRQKLWKVYRSASSSDIHAT